MKEQNANEKQIKELIENWALAVRNRDIAAILAHHSEDMVMYDVPPPFQSNGIAAYRESWNTFFAFTKRGVFDILELHITAGDEVAFCFAKMKCEDKSGSNDYLPLEFRLTIGLKKINGQWIIVHEHHSVPAE